MSGEGGFKVDVRDNIAVDDYEVVGKRCALVEIAHGIADGGRG